MEKYGKQNNKVSINVTISYCACINDQIHVLLTLARNDF